jgi:hypothetical protein
MRLILGMALAVCASCAQLPNKTTTTLACSESWFKKIEQRIFTADSQGHGPDLGSLEWRHTVEFKLGLRGNSPVWCDYIDKYIIQTSK